MGTGYKAHTWCLLLLTGCVALSKSPDFPGSQIRSTLPAFQVSVATDWREAGLTCPVLRAGLWGFEGGETTRAAALPALPENNLVGTAPLASPQHLDKFFLLIVHFSFKNRMLENEF